ncbi:MAG: DUF2062 domain-containing protein [Proteobacteria bacterium]|nr:DUF2062 domain-containing protein [Pseudomonadota bacterium]
MSPEPSMRQSVKRQILKSRKIKEHRVLGYFGEAFDRRCLWHVTRFSVAKAFAVGVFSAYLPVPFEMIIAAILAYIVRANLPISVILIWISNPFTWALLWGPPYLLGALILGEPGAPVPVLTREWIQDHYSALFLGCSLVGAAMGVAAYFTVLLLWRLDVVKRWELRRDLRTKREQEIKVGGSS